MSTGAPAKGAQAKGAQAKGAQAKGAQAKGAQAKGALAKKGTGGRGKAPEPCQLGLNFHQWGGRRPGAGRKRTSRRVSHQKRPVLSDHHPAHVTLKVHRHLPNLRSCMRVLRPALAAGATKADFRLVHFSVQKHHLHLLVEASHAVALSRGIQGLCIRIARSLNRLLGRRRGKVFADRYHLRILKTPQEVHRCLGYVLHNGRKHLAQQGRVMPRGWLDPCCSARYFDGWECGPMTPPRGESLPVARPQSWLLRVGWRRHGLIRNE